MADRLEVMAVAGIGEVTPGTDLAAVIVAAAPWLRDGDVIVVTSKVVSKAEGRLADVPLDGPERDAVREELLAAETARPVARRGSTRIVQTHHGFVLAGAGIDASNVDPSRLVLLPKDPDASARGLRSALRDRYGLDVAVIVSDTMGRPWRNGLTDVALGAAGIEPVRDYRGQTDPYGNELHITQMAIVDELASAAELVKGKADQIPVAVVRGYSYAGAAARASEASALWHGPGAAALVRAAEADLFSLGTAEARAAGLRDAAALPDATAFGSGPVDTSALTRALRAVSGLAVELAPAVGPDLPPGTTHVIRCSVPSDRPGAAGDPPGLAGVADPPGLAGAADPPGLAGAVAAGVAVHRLRCALAAEGLASAWLTAEPSTAAGRLIGRLAVGPS
jgi:coenzyme F420-0:L-glutamate ligase/coenzyme F420-1:gamma-L-glutamate ligase